MAAVPAAGKITITLTDPEPTETQPTEWEQELLQILWTMGEVLGEQIVILEELSQHMALLRTTGRETRNLLEQEQKDMAVIRSLLEQEQEQQRMEQDGKKRGRRFSFPISKINLPRPSLGWLFLPLSLVVLWALWHSLGALWSVLSPILP